METTDRMMIVGLCLQGLLANPLWMKRYIVNTRTGEASYPLFGAEIGDDSPIVIEETFPRLMTPEELAAQRERIYKEALLMADLLDPRPAKVQAEAIATHTKAAWAVLRAAAAGREPYDEAVANDAEGVGWVFERVSRWVADPVGQPTDFEDALIRAVVLGE